MVAMKASAILAQYESRIGELQIGLGQTRLHSALAATVLVLAVGLFLTLALFAVRQRTTFLWPSTALPFAAASAGRLISQRRSRYRMWRLRWFYDRSVQRVKGDWAGNGETGAEFEDSAHPYASDLKVMGEGSLFELLCTARTSMGRRGLAQHLLKPPPVEETMARQEAVRELKHRTSLRERVALLGKFDFCDAQWETFSEWLEAPPVAPSQALRMLTLITSALLLGLFVDGMTTLIPWLRVAACAAPLVAFHALVGRLFQARVRRTVEQLRAAPPEATLLREGLQVLEGQSFQSAKLRDLVERARNSSKSVAKLERLMGALEARNREWFYGPYLVLLLATQLCWAIEHWRIVHRAELRTWIDAWAEFEALNALANYAYENSDNPFPEFASGEARFEADSLGHPLIPESACVRSDVQLNRQSRFYLISGSNMSGKSTLLRAIGLNAVLAAAGAPVRAGALRLSRLSVCASLSVVDSLLNGKSKFMAEVDRLRHAIQTATGEVPVLFLIDEIFTGTNSRDRRVAAEAVVRTLVSRGAIGALSTHDLALTEIAESAGLAGANVHMGSKDGRDPMEFDYRLKPGVTTETNALAIARLAGVPV